MKHIADLFQSRLGDLYAPDELKAVMLWTVEELTGMSRSQVLLCKDSANEWKGQTEELVPQGGLSRVQPILSKSNNFSPEVYERAAYVVDRLHDGLPIQYVFGRTTLRGLDWKVDERVLIPRPETAELVDLVLSALGKDSDRPLDVLDAGTGSGFIAVSLKVDRPAWRVTGGDVSAEALEVARQNADMHHAEVRFMPLDLLDSSTWPTHGLDLLVSNPPYVAESERAGMSPTVVQHEPSLALFVPDDNPLLFYQALSQLGRRQLTAGGLLAVEASSLRAEQVAELFERQGFREVQLHSDLSGLPRMITAKQPS